MKPTNFKLKRSKLKTLFIVMMLGTSCLLHGQVTIGSGYEPNSNALLDLQEN